MPIVIPQIINIKINTNKPHFIKLGYDLSNKKKGDFLEVNVNDLLPTSKILVNCICDYCGKKCMKTYHYTLLVNNKICCDKYCAILKSKEEYFKKYGVEHPMQLDKTKEKIKQTNLERYGVENVYQSEEIKDKIKQSNLLHNNVEYPMQSKDIREKSKQTCLEKYGVDHISKNEDIKQQKINTNIITLWC